MTPPSTTTPHHRSAGVSALELRTRYTSLGHLWYAWQTDTADARQRLEQVLGVPVPSDCKEMQAAHWDALLAVVRDILDTRAASTSWMREIINRGQLTHTLVDRLLKECHGVNPDDIRARWLQQSVLTSTARDVEKLVRAGDIDAARALADAGRAFLRRWVAQIPDAPSRMQLTGVFAVQLDAYLAAWTAAKCDLARDVRKLTVTRLP